MAKIYKIHPAIGVDHLGGHPSAYCIGPEAVGPPGTELDDSGAECPLTSYETDGRVKRQAARFRVLEYDQDHDGTLHLLGEADTQTQVERTVDLVNRKGALARTVSPAQPRNTGVPNRESLVIRNPHPVSVTGPSRPGEVLQGQFLGTIVCLDEARTDPQDRLIVLGGRGESGSVPPGEPLGNFADNDAWHGDVSDGPVSATVTVPGQESVVVHEGAWVVVAPPDFAPAVHSVVSLYDIAYQAGTEKGAPAPAAAPSFTQHIRPMIERAADLRCADSLSEWNGRQPIDCGTLSDPEPGSQTARRAMVDVFRSPGLSAFRLSSFMATHLQPWEAGDIVDDLAGGVPEPPLPEQLDRAALDGCSGDSFFFPRIEGGQSLKDKDIYARPFRLDPANAALAAYARRGAEEHRIHLSTRRENRWPDMPFWRRRSADRPTFTT